LKKQMSLFALAAFLTLACISHAEQGSFTVEPQAWINAGETRPLYESVDSGSKALRELSSGEAFELLALNDSWAEILVFSEAGDRLHGWVTPEGLRLKNADDGAALAIVYSPDPSLRVHLRTSASKGAKSLGKYFSGVVVRVLDQKGGIWARVRIGSLEGYMETDSLVLDGPVGSVPSLIPTVLVNYQDGFSLTLRAGQSYQSGKQGAVPNGQPVRVLGVTEEFAHVLTEDGKTGFMMASALTPQPVYADIPYVASIPRPDGAVSVIDNPGGQGAHLRQRGSTASESLGLYPNGTEVVVTGGTVYWKKVWVDGRTGYMMAQLIRGFVPEEFQEGGGD